MCRWFLRVFVSFSLLDFMFKSLWLALASPSRIAAAIGLCLTLMLWEGFFT
jgi:hypothetical protein